jgi:hypothetical protein
MERGFSAVKKNGDLIGITAIYRRKDLRLSNCEAHIFPTFEASCSASAIGGADLSQVFKMNAEGVRPLRILKPSGEAEGSLPRHVT